MYLYMNKLLALIYHLGESTWGRLNITTFGKWR